MAALYPLAKLSSHRYIEQRDWITVVTLLALLCALLLIEGCGFQRQSAIQLPERLRLLSLQSDDPYGHLARAISDQLRYHHLTLLEASTDAQKSTYARLQLLNTSENRVALSVFPDGKGAQYQITYRILAQLHLPKYPAPLQQAPPRTLPLRVVVQHTFFDNPMAALAKGSEQETMRQQLYQLAASQLVMKVLTILVREARPAIEQPDNTTSCEHAAHPA